MASTVADGRSASLIDVYAALPEDEIGIETVGGRDDAVVETNVEMSRVGPTRHLSLRLNQPLLTITHIKIFVQDKGTLSHTKINERGDSWDRT